MPTKEEMILNLRARWKNLDDLINKTYGPYYPPDKDKDGWRLLGQKEGMSAALFELEED